MINDHRFDVPSSCGINTKFRCSVTFSKTKTIKKDYAKSTFYVLQFFSTPGFYMPKLQKLSMI